MKRRSFFGAIAGLFAGVAWPWKAKAAPRTMQPGSCWEFSGQPINGCYRVYVYERKAGTLVYENGVLVKVLPTSDVMVEDHSADEVEHFFPSSGLTCFQNIQCQST